MNVLFRIVNVLAALKKFFKQKVALEMYYYTPTASELSGSRGGAPENFEFPVLFWLILSTSKCARWRRTSRTEGGASRICPARCPPDTKAKSGSWSGGGRPSQAVNRPQACAVSKYSTPDETHEIFF